MTTEKYVFVGVPGNHRDTVGALRQESGRKLNTCSTINRDDMYLGDGNRYKGTFDHMDGKPTVELIQTFNGDVFASAVAKIDYDPAKVSDSDVEDLRALMRASGLEKE